MKNYAWEAVNTLHWMPTGIFYVCKKTGKKKEKKRKVIHRRLFLTALPDAKLIGAAGNVRVVQVRRSLKVKGPDGKTVINKGTVTSYSLAERKESPRPWWESAPPTVAREYTRVKSSSNGRVEPLMTRDEMLRYLSGHVEGPEAVLDALENGEPLEGDARWHALEKYGYDKPEYEEEEGAEAA